MDNSTKKSLQNTAAKIRLGILEEVFSASSGHPGGSLSIADIFVNSRKDDRRMSLRTFQLFKLVKCLCGNRSRYGTDRKRNKHFIHMQTGVRIVVSVIGECAIAVDGIVNAKERERTAVLAKNEQLRANLLRSISHDLRTPLTSISGNASNLISNGNAFDDATKMQIYEDIYSDSLWLINLVENLLAVTRLEEGRMNINLTTELVRDVIDEALKHIHKKSEMQKITVIQQDELLLAKMDARLIVQVLINLLDNAIKYTPSDSQITITAKKDGNMISVSVSDNGNGIADEQKSRVFDMFYTGTSKIVDSRRSIGLGLSLCKSIINAHGGEITITDNVPHGAVFTFTLPVGEVEIHE